VFEELEENKPREQKPTDYSGVIAFACTLPVIWYFSHIGKFELGLNVGICLAIAGIVGRIYWDLRGRVWFWTILVVVFAMHLLFVARIHWPNRWVPSIELLPIGLADLLIYVGAINLAKKLFMKTEETNPEEI